MRSDIRLPTDGELHIFSPGAVQRDGACGRDCMYVGAFDVPPQSQADDLHDARSVLDLRALRLHLLLGQGLQCAHAQAC